MKLILALLVILLLQSAYDIVLHIGLKLELVIVEQFGHHHRLALLLILVVIDRHAVVLNVGLF